MTAATTCTPEAIRFGKALAAAMAARVISEKQLAKTVKCSRSQVRQCKSGYNLPSLESGVAWAKALESDSLATLIVECRTVSCASCGAPFVNPGTPQRYCSDICKQVAAKLLVGTDSRKRAAVAEDLVKELQGQRRQTLAHVAAMCSWCEESGICRMADCPLRAISPFPLDPLLESGRKVPVAVPAAGPWGAENRATTLKGIQESNARCWERPGEREKASERLKSRWDRKKSRAGQAHGQGVKA